MNVMKGNFQAQNVDTYCYLLKQRIFLGKQFYCSKATIDVYLNDARGNLRSVNLTAKETQFH